MPTKVLTKNIKNIREYGKTYLPKEETTHIAAHPKEVLQHMVKNNMRLLAYRSVYIGHAGIVEHQGETYEQHLRIASWQPPKGLEVNGSVEDLILLANPSAVYDEEFFKKLIHINLFHYQESSLVRNYGGTAKLYDAIANNHESLPIYTEIGQVLFGEEFKQKNLRDYAPRLPETKEVKGLRVRHSIPSNTPRR